MTVTRKNRICTLLKGIETGDPAAVAVVSPDAYIQHNPQTHEGGEGLAALFKRLSKSAPRVNIVRVFADGLAALRSALSTLAMNQGITIRYDRMHRILAEGNFVLSVCEGAVNGAHSSFFDLFRVAHGKLVEHWDTTEALPPRNEWKNDNGKF